MRLFAGANTRWHTQDELAYETAWYTTPTLLQRFTKAIPLFLSSTIIIILWVEFVHALLKHSPEVLNWI